MQKVLFGILTIAFIATATISVTADEARFGPLVSAEELAKLRLTETPFILDIRGNAGKDGYIPGAISVDYGAFRGPATNPGQLITDAHLTTLFQKLGLVVNTTTVIVYQGRNETDFGAAARVYWTLKSAGIHQLAILNGGMNSPNYTDCELSNANSSEFSEDTPFPVIALLPGQENLDLGGTMRLGSYPGVLKSDTLASKIYNGSNKFEERHRHRYELNNKYRDSMEKNGLIFSGISPNDELVEIIEISGHPFYFGCQFHPEFKSAPFSPHPVFVSFVEAAKNARSELFK